jgi:hypothetical protein
MVYIGPMSIHIIKTDADLDAALARVEEIFDSEPGSPEFDELKAWTALISAYEGEHHPFTKEESMEIKSARGREWKEFSDQILEHIEAYTVPQYGDYPSDQMTTASIEDIKHNLKRYINRMSTNARGEQEAIRDLKKIAHYAGIAWGKRVRGEAGRPARRIEFTTYLSEVSTQEIQAFLAELDEEYDEVVVRLFREEPGPEPGPRPGCVCDNVPGAPLCASCRGEKIRPQAI